MNKEQDELTLAIAAHNKAVADAIHEAERSLAIAHQQLAEAEKSLVLLKKVIKDTLENHGGKNGSLD